jgi:hypothetical protein
MSQISIDPAWWLFFLHFPQVVQQHSQAGVLGICADASPVCSRLQSTFTAGAELSFALVMLSVIICLGVAVQFDAWITHALVFFQLSIWSLAVALTVVIQRS